jgi:hypothetical protein
MFYGWHNGSPKVDTRTSAGMSWCVSGGDNAEQLLPSVEPRAHAAEESLIQRLLQAR